MTVTPTRAVKLRELAKLKGTTVSAIVGRLVDAARVGDTPNPIEARGGHAPANEDGDTGQPIESAPGSRVLAPTSGCSHGVQDVTKLAVGIWRCDTCGATSSNRGATWTIQETP